MRLEQFPISGSEIGTLRTLTALHFGDEKSGRKIYIQAGLNADEPLSSLAAFHLRQGLSKLEKAGQLKSHIVLIPMANPAGFRQTESVVAVNDLLDRVSHLFDVDTIEFTEANCQSLRLSMKRALQSTVNSSLIENVYLTLLQLASDADMVIDLHCDGQHALHVATTHQSAGLFEPLARYLDNDCPMFNAYLDEDSFSAILSSLWTKLAIRHPHATMPFTGATVSLGLRGSDKMNHKIARQNAQAIIQFLSQQGDIDLTEVQLQVLAETGAKPNLLKSPEKVAATCSGLAVYYVAVGSWVRAGETLADIIDPIQGVTKPVLSPVAGLVFASHHIPSVKQGDCLYEISPR